MRVSALRATHRIPGGRHGANRSVSDLRKAIHVAARRFDSIRARESCTGTNTEAKGKAAFWFNAADSK